MKFLVILSIALTITFDATGQDNFKDNRLTKREMQEDFLFLKEVFEQANAGLYHYRTKEELDALFEQSFSQIPENGTYRTLFNLLWSYIDFSGSCHNDLLIPEEIDSQLNELPIFFPIPLKWMDGGLYTNLTYQGIPSGSKVFSVNEEEVNVFARRIAQYTSTDGHNVTGKLENIQSDWMAFHIYLAYGPLESFALELMTPEGKRKNVNWEAVNYTDYFLNHQKRYSASFEEEPKLEYSFEIIDSISSGLLTVSTFAFGGPSSGEHKAYSHFLDSIMQKANASNLTHLILDIRGNGGGSDPNDLLTYSYLTDRNFRENTEAFTIFQNVPYPENYVEYYEEDIEELQKELKEEHCHRHNGRFYQDSSFNRVWHPKEHAFKGKVILLIDPFVASAASLFASLIKSDPKSVVIGEETLGGYYGHTGHIPVTYELPNSKMELSFSIVDLRQDVRELPDEKPMDGVVPDIRIIQSLDDYLENRDVQLIEAIRYVQKEQDPE